jgi:hypothetical protein
MRKVVVATIAIWAAGMGSAAALVTTLSRPPVPVSPTELAREPAREEPPPDLARFKVPRPLDLLSAPAKVRSEVRLPIKPRREMKCGAFRSMQAGPMDHAVRYCH